MEKSAESPCSNQRTNDVCPPSDEVAPEPSGEARVVAAAAAASAETSKPQAGVETDERRADRTPVSADDDDGGGSPPKNADVVRRRPEASRTERRPGAGGGGGGENGSRERDAAPDPATPSDEPSAARRPRRQQTSPPSEEEETGGGATTANNNDGNDETTRGSAESAAVAVAPRPAATTTTAVVPAPVPPSRLALPHDFLLEIYLQGRANEIAAAAANGGGGGAFATASAAAAVAGPQIVIADSSSPRGQAQSPSAGSRKKGSGGGQVSAAGGAVAAAVGSDATSSSKRVEPEKRQADSIAAGAGGSGNQKSPGSTGKKKKKKNKKKKKKSSNSNTTKAADSTDQNQKANPTSTQEMAEEKKSDGESTVAPACAPNNKGTESSKEDAVVAAAAFAAATDRQPKTAKTVAKEPSSGNKTKTNDKNEKPSGSNGKAGKKGSATTPADVPPEASAPTTPAKKPEATKAKSADAKNPDSKEKSKDGTDSGPTPESSSSSSAPTAEKKVAPDTDDQAKAEDADDGEWATVEVKPRGRRGKGGGKKSSSGGQNNKTSNSANHNNNNNHNHNHTNNHNNHNTNHKNHNHNNQNHNNHHNNHQNNHNNHNNHNHNSSNNAGGNRNHNNDHGGNHNDGGGHHRRRNRKHRAEHKQKTNNNNNQHQQTKLVKEVIALILDGVDDEVMRREGDAGKTVGKQGGGGAKCAEDVKRGNKLGDGGKGRPTGNGKHPQRKQSGATSGRPAPPPIASQSSSKSLRDVLVGATALAASGNDPARTKVDEANKAEGGGACGKGDPDRSSTKGSSRIRTGMSYRTVVEPAPPPAPTPPRPVRTNAWAKPPTSIKAEPAAEAVVEKVNLVPKLSSARVEVPPVPVDTGSVAPSGNCLAAPGGSGPAAPSAPLPVEEAPTAPTGEIEGESRRPGEDAACQTSDTEDVAAEAEEAITAPSPPLSTLLGPGGSCGSSSSVASSLEAPHCPNRFGACPSSSRVAEDDVGYHLLNVCGQLSEEINTFMSRRALALDVRRKEREAVLCALGDTLGKIWPGQCQVEMYGSCATQLDLPSSDLDLVVCGLDDVVNHPPPVDQQALSSSHGNSCNSFQDEEVPQERVDASMIIQHPGQEQPMTPDTHHVTGNGVSNSFQEGAEGGVLSTPDNQFVGNLVEGDAGMNVDESAKGMGMEYSPATTGGGEVYSPEYQVASQQEGGVGSMENYSPGYTYHSNQQDVVSTAENYTPVYAAEEMGMDGYAHEYQPNGQEQFYYSPYDYVSTLSLNAQRVLRLASELEVQPWAVQVKAIPTATVPVVKMLADPSRLPGLAGSGGDDWMMQQHIAAQAGVAPGTSPSSPMSPEQISAQNQGSVSPSSHFMHPMTQWRGTDIKNGLQPVDITFEGPEHGGIGSTTYSLRVVEDASEETGLPPESTPVVQVASVLKELLAQRRLNEPFSGGLSSYGLLMLLLAVVKDRRIIQEQMKKIEKQLQNVSGPDNREARISPKPRTSGAPSSAQAVASQSASPGVESSDKSSAAPSTTSKPTISSSWASIAKKSNESTARTESLSTVTKLTNDSATTAKTGVNYNQIVQKETSETAQHGEQVKDQPLANKQLADTSNGDFNAQLPDAERLSAGKKQNLPQSSNVALDGPAVLSQFTPFSEDDGKIASSSLPQGSNDVFEVLCSGELTSGKLLMHFLLFYGQHFDSQSTLIDINGTHHPEYGIIDLERLSPFVARPPGGTIDPITGMFSVDPIVVYDPLEGAINHNVSKRCYCWNNVRWVFAQCYMTVSSVVETSDTGTKSSSLSKHKRDANHESSKSGGDGKPGIIKSTEQAGSNPDVVTPILELLLSF